MNYNSDLIEYLPGVSSAKSLDGKVFHFTGAPSITTAADSMIAEAAFEVYVTKDTTSSLSLGGIVVNASDPAFMGCVAFVESNGTEFHSSDLCGDGSIRKLIRDGNIIGITSIHPNPATDNIAIDLQSGSGGYHEIAVYDQLGEKVLSRWEDIQARLSTATLSTASLASGVYVVRFGNSSATFLRTR
ncbi:MAG: T9SS type A sorting domain-containing protein, partial [Ignavibacteriota bacterium]